MRLRSLGFAGYRSFSARSPASPDRPLQQLAIAPLTILLGKNNSGKSTTARLLRHVLLALSSEGSDPFPVAGAGKVYARSFRDLQHQTFFLNPIDLRVGLRSESGADTELSAQLIQLTDADDEKPIAQNLRASSQSPLWR